MMLKDLELYWRSRLAADFATQSAAVRDSIFRWLLKDDYEHLTRIEQFQMQAMQYKYSILRQRYLGVSPTEGYCRLIARLGRSVQVRHKIGILVVLGRDRNRTVKDFLEEVVADVITSDRKIQKQINWITKLTKDQKLRSALFFTTCEEYFLRKVRSKPLILYRAMNYQRYIQRGGLTKLPTTQLLRLVSTEIPTQDSAIDLLNNLSIGKYQKTQKMRDEQSQRNQVTQEFSRYLAQKLSPIAVEWLKLYLEGHSQSAIAQKLNLPVQEVYRIREKITYHAVRVFAPKYQSLMRDWLKNT